MEHTQSYIRIPAWTEMRDSFNICRVLDRRSYRRIHHYASSSVGAAADLQVPGIPVLDKKKTVRYG